MRRVLGCLSLILPLGAATLPGIDPGAPADADGATVPFAEAGEVPDPATGELLVGDLRGLFIVDAGEAVDAMASLDADKDPPAAGSAVVVAPTLPSPRSLAAKLAPRIGEPLHEGGLEWIAEGVLGHLEAEGFPVAEVDVPVQDLDDGVLRIELRLGRVGAVGLGRTVHADPDPLSRGLHLRPGESLSRGALETQLDWYARNPFLQPRLFVSPGEAPATADVLIGFEERRPWTVYAGYDNSGVELIGRDRWTVGALAALPDGQLIGWQSQLGAPLSSYHAHGLRWELPVPGCRSVWRLDAAYAEVDASYLQAGSRVNNDGRSWLLAGSHRMQLPALAGWRQVLGLGAELKGTDQFLLFGGAAVSPGAVIFAQARIDHELRRDWREGGARLSGSVVAAPGNLFGDNSDRAFQGFDPRAGSAYWIGRLDGEGWWRPGGGWELRGRAAGQWSDSHLLPAEQIAVGGRDTVRGLEERELLGDAGWWVSSELWTPEWTIGERAGLRGLVFIDHGTLRRRGGMDESVSGAGIGLRLQVARNVSLRYDHAWRLDDDGQQDYFGVTVAY